MNKQFESIIDFDITYDAEYMAEHNPIPFELEQQMDNLYKLAYKGKKAGIKRISRLIQKYPHVPVLKNYLSVLYSKMGDDVKSNKVNHTIVEQHPDYLYGLVNLASEYYYNNQYEKMIDVLGKNFNLKELYPEREVFHIDEVIAMFKMAIMYYSAVGKFDEARVYLGFIEKEDGFEDDFEDMEFILDQNVMAQGFFGDNDVINVKETPTIYTDNNKAPVFEIQLIEQLYTHDTEIEHKTIDELLKKDRKLLINDLNKVLKDSIDRYKYFSEKAEEEGYVEEELSFLIHALFLLGELEASESLENVFEILSQDRDFADFYIGDILTEILWITIYEIANNDLEACKQFMQKPGINAFHKIIVSEAITIVAFQQPERYKEVADWYKSLFNFFISSSIDDNVIDSNLIGMMISEVIDLNGLDLMPQIEQLFEKQMVDTMACGILEKVKSEIENPIFNSYKREILDIYSIYKKIQAWGDDSYIDKNNDTFIEDNLQLNNHVEKEETPVQILREGRKIGRNEPCPCGSGKKYKKCCLNK